MPETAAWEGLLFYCADEEALPRIRVEGVQPAGEREILVYTSLEAAQAACPGCLLVIDPTALEEAVTPGAAGYARVGAIPAGALRNADPYLPPMAVTAAGGYLVRPGLDGLEVLLIFRRGVWDLPKGKCDAGEPVEACALREVSEEVGARRVRIVSGLGETVHGYAEGGKYRVKTTHWFLMRTPETNFTPQAEEDIEAVVWVAWEEAGRRLGFASLRRHMRRASALVHQILL